MFGLATLFSLVLFAILWRLDFPKPYMDDLFYCGGSLNLAQGGGLSNPMIAGQGFHNSFFVYPPLEFYALAGWLKVFGISAASMTGYAILMYFLIAVVTIALLRHYRAPRWLEWIAPVCVCAAFMRTGGLRPEPLSIALMMIGFAIIECGGRSKGIVFLSFLLLFMGGSTAPRMVPFCLTFFGLALLRLRSGTGAGQSNGWNYFWLAGAAGLASGTLFLLLIHFRLSEFLETFRMHSTRNTGVPFSLYLASLLYHVMSQLMWPLLALPILLLIAFRREPWDRLKTIAVSVLIVFVLAGCLKILWPCSIWYAIFASLLLAGSGFASLSRLPAIALGTIFLLALLIANGQTLLNIYGMLSGHLRNDPGDQRPAALALRPTPEHRVIVDVNQARYLFDYHIPPGVLSFEYAATFPIAYAD